MVLVKTVKFGHVFIFRRLSQKNVFDNILETKKCFQDHKNEKLKKSKNWDFFKGVSPCFGQKCKIWPCFYFSQNKPPKNEFNNILERTNAFKTVKTRS